VTEPAALDEIVAIRNRLVDQRQKANDTLSLTLRTVGMGLAAITFSFVFAVTPNPALSAHKAYIFAASAFGASSIAFDILQSFADRRSAQDTLDFLRDCGERIPNPSEIVACRKRRGTSAAFALLVFRALACCAGFLCLLVGISKSL